MAFKFDTKLAKIADDFAEFDLLKPKDRHGPRFQTQETDSLFILCVQLKGYRLADIKVGRNKDGSKITIYGEKPVQDTLMVGGKIIKKDIEIQRFSTSFKVPEGVVLDKVEVRFNEDNSELIIRMPKATKGFTGFVVEELKTKESLPDEPAEFLHVYANGELSDQENDERYDQDKEKPEEEQTGTNHADGKEDDGQEPDLPERRFKRCTPVIVGSTFFVSLVVLIFHLVQSRKPVKEQKKTDED